MHLIKIVNELGRVLFIANVVCGQVTQIIVRGLKEKRFQTLSHRVQLPYGLGSMKDKRFNEPMLC